MDRNYPLVHATKSSLVTDLKNLADDYRRGDVTDAEMADLLAKWTKNTPNFFFSVGETGGYETVLSARIKKLIGDKRALIIQTFLNDLTE